MLYTVKDPEDIYTEDTTDERLEALRQKKSGPKYVVKTIKAGRWLECLMYPQWNNPKAVPRGPKKNLSSEQQRAANEKNTRRNFTRKINENFLPMVDYWATFTCDDDHLVETEDEGRKIITRFIARLRYAAKKAGKELKYAYTIEYKAATRKGGIPILSESGGEMIRPHIHIVMNAIGTQRDIMDCWTAGAIKNVRILQADRNGFAGLAAYITKTPRAGRRRYACSKNLRPPKETTAKHHKMAGMRNVQKIAVNENIRPEFFEKMYRGKYTFVDCAAKWSGINDGVYFYCRMEQKRPAEGWPEERREKKSDPNGRPGRKGTGVHKKPA